MATFDVTVETTYRVDAVNIEEAMRRAETLADGSKAPIEAARAIDIEVTGVNKV